MVVKADDFSKRMCAAMRKAHMKAIDLHNLTGIGKPSISAYMAGEYEPKQRNLYKIAKALNVSTQYLMGIEDEQPPSPAPYQPYRAELTERDERHGVKIPILGRVVAGLPAYADQEVLGYDEITQERARTGEFFALIVRGDSMEPLFMAGDHVIVERQPDVDSGDVAIVGVDGDDATIKRVQKVDGGIILQPENRAYKPMYFSDKDIIDKPVTIFGRVVEQRRTKF